jgi:hypothetical protein
MTEASFSVNPLHLRISNNWEMHIHPQQSISHQVDRGQILDAIVTRIACSESYQPNMLAPQCQQYLEIVIVKC